MTMAAFCRGLVARSGTLLQTMAKQVRARTVSSNSEAELTKDRAAGFLRQLLGETSKSP